MSHNKNTYALSTNISFTQEPYNYRMVNTPDKTDDPPFSVPSMSRLLKPVAIQLLSNYVKHLYSLNYERTY